MTKRQLTPLLGTTLAAAILALLCAAGPAHAGLAPVRAWAANTSAQLSQDPGARTVERRLAALRRITREVRVRAAMRRRPQLARTGRTLDHSLIGLRTTLRGLPRYAFYLGLQAEAERLGHRSGGGHRPRRHRRHRRRATPTATASATAPTASPRGWGVPDAFRVRAPTAVPATGVPHAATASGLTEQIPSPATIAGRTRASATAPRSAAAHRPGTTRATTTAKKPITLRKAKIKAKSATLDGRTLKLSIKTKKTAKFRFEVVTGTQVVARAKPRKIKGAKKPKAKTITASLDRVPTGDTLKLRITARLGKKTARGQIRLKVITPSGPPGPPGPPKPPPPSCTPGADTDGDTIPDCQEIQGFNFTYYLPAAQCTGIGNAFSCLSARSRKVTSDPTKANTDGDAVIVDGTTFALTDADEWALNLTGGLSDPSNKDSDQDGLVRRGGDLQVGHVAGEPGRRRRLGRPGHAGRPAQPQPLRQAGDRRAAWSRGAASRPRRPPLTPTATAWGISRRSSTAPSAP